MEQQYGNSKKEKATVLSIVPSYDQQPTIITCINLLIFIRINLFIQKGLQSLQLK